MSPSSGSTSEQPAWKPHLKEQTQALDRIRAGLEAWMRRRLEDPGTTITGMRPPSGTGVANETVIFDVARTRGSAAGTTEGYVARLATPDSLYLDYDLAVHYRMYETMMEFPSVPTPRVLGYEADADVVGAPFFVMEKIDGVIPTDRPSWASEGFIVDAVPAQRRALWERTVRMMAAAAPPPHRAIPVPAHGRDARTASETVSTTGCGRSAGRNLRNRCRWRRNAKTGCSPTRRMSPRCRGATADCRT